MNKKLEQALNELTGMVLGERVHVIHAKVVEDGDGRVYLDAVWIVLVPGLMAPQGVQLREGSVRADLARLPVDARRQVRDALASQKIDGPFRHELLTANLLHPEISDIAS